MKPRIKQIIAFSAIGFLLLGHLAYLFAVYQGRAETFSAAIDQPGPRILALVLLVAVVAMPFLPNRSKE